MKNAALRVSGIVFFLIAVLHLLRLIFRIDVVAGGFVIPQWVSLIGLAVAGAFSVWLLKESK